MTRDEMEREIKAAMREDLLAWAAGMRDTAHAAQRRLEQLRGRFTEAGMERLGDEVAAETACHPTIKLWERNQDRLALEGSGPETGDES